MHLTLKGWASLTPHDSKTPVNRLRFTADSDFEVPGNGVSPAGIFDQIAYGDRLLDWKQRANAVLARSMEFRQRVEITIERNGRYWEILSVTILGPVQFNPTMELRHRTLMNCPLFDALPASVKAELRENEAMPRKPFMIYPHGPWTSPTGRPEDVVSLKNYNATAAQHATIAA